MATAIIDDNCSQELTRRGYGGHLLSKFREFWEGGLFCDFTLIVGKEIFKVHRAVLSGCSDYFLAMFSHGMMETTTDSLELQSVSVQGLRPLLRYAYTGKITLALDSVGEILAVATFLQITTAIELCADFLKSVMTFENAKHLLTLADNYGLMGIKEYHQVKVMDNFMDFAETDEFLQLDSKEISNYLMDDALKTSRESNLLTCALKWYNHDKVGREPVVHDVIDKIRFALDGWPTIDLAQKHDLFKSNKCAEILSWTRQYLQEPHKRPLRQNYRTRVRNGKKTLVQIGGMKNFRPQGTLGFALPGEEEDWYEREQSGCDSNFYYDRHEGYWVPLGVAAHSDCRSHCPIVQVNDLGIMVGGYLYTTDFETTLQHYSTEVKLFSPDGFSLWDMPYLNCARAHHVAVYCADFLYAIGGKNGTGALASVERYDLEKEEWECVCRLTHGLYDHAAAAYRGKVYVTGGVKGDEIISSLLCYDPGQDQWSEMTDMLSARACHSMALVGKELYVCGGRPVRNSTTCLSSVESFNVELNQWSYVTPMRQDCACMTAAVLDGQLLVVGGESSTGDLLQSVQMFDPEAKTWMNHSDLLWPLKNLGCAVLTLKFIDDSLEETGEESYADTYDEDYVDHDGFLHDNYALSSSEGEGSLEDLLVALRGAGPWVC